MKTNPKVNYNWFREWGFVNKSFEFFRKGSSSLSLPPRLPRTFLVIDVHRTSLRVDLSVAGEIGDWLNHFDVDQSKAYDEMVSRRVSPSVGRFNYGISSADQQRLYDFHDEQQRSSSSS